MAPLLRYVDLVSASDGDESATVPVAPAALQDDARSLSHVIRSLRGLFFTSTKLFVLEELLRANVARPAPAATSQPRMGGGFGLGSAPAFGQGRLGQPGFARAAFRAPHITINRMRAATPSTTALSVPRYALMRCPSPPPTQSSLL